MNFKPFMINLSEDNIPEVAPFSAIEVNSRRPYRGDKRPDLAYITREVGRNEDGTPKHEAQLVGNATTSTLYKDEWKYIDDAILTTRQKRMTFVNWLIDQGCVIDIPNGLGVTQYEWPTLTSLEGADMSMDGLKQTDTDRAEYGSDSIPLPIVSRNWRLNQRFLEESRRKGIAMDTYLASEAARVSAEFVENTAVNGTNSFKYAGSTLYGLLDSPNVSALSTGNGLFTKAWDDATITGNAILKDVIAMVKRMNANRRYGKFALWLPQKYQAVLADDYTTGYPKTVETRLMESGMLTGIHYSDFFTVDGGGKDRIALISPVKETIAVVRGMEFRDFEWNTFGGWVIEHKVAGIYAPLIRKDAGGMSGIVKATLA